MSVATRSLRPTSGARFQAYAWFFMRLSGILLIVLALFHFFWMHFVIGVEHMDFNTIVGRWTEPTAGGWSWFWRIYDLFLLVFAFTHGMNGGREVLEDHITDERARRVLAFVLVAIWAVLIFMGAWIIFTFRPGMPSPFNLPINL